MGIMQATGDFGRGIDSGGTRGTGRGTCETNRGKRLRRNYTTDSALIGGAVVRIGSTIYDGSVRTQLERMRARMISE